MVKRRKKERKKEGSHKLKLRKKQTQGRPESWIISSNLSTSKQIYLAKAQPFRSTWNQAAHQSKLLHSRGPALQGTL